MDSVKLHASLDSLFKFNPDGEGNFVAHPPKEMQVLAVRKWILESFQKIVTAVDVPPGLPHRVGKVLELLRDFQLEHEGSEKSRGLWQQIQKQMSSD